MVRPRNGRDLRKQIEDMHKHERPADPSMGTTVL